MTAIDPSIASGLSADQQLDIKAAYDEELIQIDGSAYQHLRSGEDLTITYQEHDFTIRYQENDDTYVVTDKEGSRLNLDIVLNQDETITLDGMPFSAGEKITIGESQDRLLDSENGHIDSGETQLKT